jgi:hypothetical protein
LRESASAWLTRHQAFALAPVRERHFRVYEAVKVVKVVEEAVNLGNC